MRRLIALTLFCFLLAGCVAGYTLVSPAPVKVAKNSMTVRPSSSWNKAPSNAFQIDQEEDWTRNGPLLDSVTFIGALPDGKAIAKQRKKDDRKVPVFRANMTPQDLVSMVETFYRVKAGATIFEVTSVKPATFLGNQGFQYDYNYVGGDEVKRRGRTLMAVVNGKLYLASYDAASVHYFDASLAEFESMMTSAAIG